MNLNIDKFCGLSTNYVFQSWLYSNDAIIYKELMTHLATSKGCSDNRNKMLELLPRLNKDALFSFLSQRFPEIIKQDVVFQYKPGLLTYPHRYIISSNDPTRDVIKFCSGKFRCEYVIVGSAAYIEYLNNAMDIPDDKWLVLKYKHNISK